MVYAVAWPPFCAKPLPELMMTQFTLVSGNLCDATEQCQHGTEIQLYINLSWHYWTMKCNVLFWIMCAVG